jgi:hypothetical protein
VRSCDAEYPALPESSELRGRFVHLAEVAVDFQQYEIARRCYEVLNDYYALLHIYAICRSAAMITLLPLLLLLLTLLYVRACVLQGCGWPQVAHC